MSRLACLVVLCLAAPALSAQESATGAQPPHGFILGNHGVIERGELRQGPAGQGRWKGFPISVSLRDAPLPEVLRTFARLADFNLVLDPRVQGSVTVELENVPWDQALYVILKTHRMGAEVDGRLWMVTPL